MNTKLYLDKLVSQYENEDFIKDDPIQFIHRFKNKKDIEIAAFIASMFAYGKREVFIKKLNILFEKMNEKPLDFVLSYSTDNHILDDFDYRFSAGVDIAQIVLILKELYSSGQTLETLFKHGYQQTHTIKGMLQNAVDYFYARVTLPVSKGFYNLLPDPAMGLWHFIDKSELIIPLDVHVAKVSRTLGILKRKQNDYQAAVELTGKLKEFCPDDPVKYDFAMFGYGVNN